MRRTIFVPLLISIALLAIAGGIGYWIFNSYYYYATDDAQVNGQLVTVTAPWQEPSAAFPSSKAIR